MTTSNQRIMKVKLFKYKKPTHYCYDCGHNDSLLLGISDWLEIDEQTYYKLRDSMHEANGISKHYCYLLIEDWSTQQGIDEVFTTAEAFIKRQKQQEKQREAKRKEYYEKKKAIKKEKELKKLATLQKKYGIK